MEPYKMRCKLYDIPGSFNVRDLGGYETLDGKRIRYGRFIRGGSLAGIEPKGAQALEKLRVSCVVDLRSTFEVSKQPDRLGDGWDPVYLRIPMLDYIQSSISAEDLSAFPTSMSEMYTGLLENGKQDFFRLFQVFADTGHPAVLYHCTAGKDRTGVSTMLLLGLAGVPNDTIVEDYSHSEGLGPPRKKAYKMLPNYLFESRPETMRAAIEHLTTNYGGIVPYLEEIGLTRQMRECIDEKLFG